MKKLLILLILVSFIFSYETIDQMKQKKRDKGYRIMGVTFFTLGTTLHICDLFTTGEARKQYKQYAIKCYSISGINFVFSLDWNKIKKKREEK